MRSAEFQVVYDHGIRITGPLLAAFCRKREDSTEGARLGLTASRALGNAVERNRLRRRFRELFRLRRSELGPWDIVLHPRRAALESPFTELEKAFRKIINRCAN